MQNVAVCASFHARLLCKTGQLLYKKSGALYHSPAMQSFFKFFLSLPPPKRLVAFTVYGSTAHTGLKYRPGDWLVFGSEVCGLSPQVGEVLVPPSAKPSVPFPIHALHFLWPLQIHMLQRSY